MKNLEHFGEPISAKIDNQTKQLKYKKNQKLNQLEIINFFKELGIIINSGLPIIESIESIKNSSKKSYTQEMLNNMILSLQNANNLSTTLSLYPNSFDNMSISLIKIGEKNGDLSKSCFIIADIKEEIQNISDKIAKSIRYPLLVSIIFFVAFISVVVLVLPQFKEIFSSYNQTLPPITEYILNISNNIQQNINIILSLILIIILTILVIFKQKLEFITDYLKVKISFIKDIFYLFEMYKFFISLKLLFGSGTNLDESMKYSINTISNRYLKTKLNIVKKSLLESKSLSKSFSSINLLDDTTIRLLVIGEKSGNIDFALENIANIMKYKLDKKIDHFAFLLENGLIFTISFFVLLLALLIFLPLWNLNSIISF
jgi:type II secretory pathway component PulF